ncbi:HSP20-like chaperone [Rhizopogon salebrosus TDB-379]|nr:HSP20-like chaperone [Rhizopogon salebrosus TDB-379]
MSLTRVFYDPFTEFDRLFDDAFNERFRTTEGGVLARRRDRVFPKMDLHENPETKTVTATMELPGLNSEDIATEVQGNRLTVSGETKRSENHEKGTYSMQERSYGKFSRTVQIPHGMKVEEVQAKMESGVLTVTFPKTAADQNPSGSTLHERSYAHTLYSISVINCLFTISTGKFEFTVLVVKVAYQWCSLRGVTLSEDICGVNFCKLTSAKIIYLRNSFMGVQIFSG